MQGITLNHELYISARYESLPGFDTLFKITCNSFAHILGNFENASLMGLFGFRCGDILHSLPRGYNKQKTKESDNAHIMISQAILVEWFSVCICYGYFVTACGHLILLEPDLKELRDYSILLYHCGFYEQSVEYLKL
ncbi:uncharacterized protein [Malus domestica]|uniref:uncharacterized protein n=1 Tax=Malus domestica TaxID=3750 RepID=UPI0039765C4F